jgi:hypothetical protein
MLLVNGNGYNCVRGLRYTGRGKIRSTQRTLWKITLNVHVVFTTSKLHNSSYERFEAHGTFIHIYYQPSFKDCELFNTK